MYKNTNLQLLSAFQSQQSLESTTQRRTNTRILVRQEKIFKYLSEESFKELEKFAHVVKDNKDLLSEFCQLIPEGAKAKLIELNNNHSTAGKAALAEILVSLYADKYPNNKLIDSDIKRDEFRSWRNSKKNLGQLLFKPAINHLKKQSEEITIVPVSFEPPVELFPSVLLPPNVERLPVQNNVTTFQHVDLQGYSHTPIAQVPPVPDAAFISTLFPQQNSRLSSAPHSTWFSPLPVLQSRQGQNKLPSLDQDDLATQTNTPLIPSIKNLLNLK